MYIEARPLSTYQSTPGWSIPPLSPGKLKQPPDRSAAPSSSSPDPRSRTPLQRPQFPGSGSSSSSLSGLEQTVPSFQSFIKRTPSKDSDKPLPPTPSLAAKRSVGSLIDSYFRRSSSVYSRTPSQWETESVSAWQTDEVAENDLPIILQPIAYSASTPDLIHEDDAPFLLEPRVFSPLIISPSPTVSTFTVDRVEPEPSPGFSPNARQSTSSHRSLMMQKRPKAEMISLEKAKQALKAPGAVPSLPEELRAQALKKTRSQGQIREVRLDSIDIFAAGGKGPQPPPLATLIDPQGRRRTLLTPPIEISTPSGEYPFKNIEAAGAKPTVPYAKAFHVGNGPVRNMTPPVAHARTVSREYVGLFPQDHDSDVSRGRRKERRPSRNAGQADTLARAYHSMLTQQQTRQASQSSGWDSDDSVRTRMKMVPQPLFQSKQVPGSRQHGGASGSHSSLSVPGRHKREDSDSSTSSGKRSTGFHLRLSPPTSTRTSSFTGMIPISPPDDHNPRRSRPPPIVTNVSGQQKTTTLKLPKSKSHLSRNKSSDAFYPRFLRKKSSKKEEQKKAEDLKQAMQPGKPLLAADIVALKLKTPESTPNTSPLANSPSLARTTSSGNASDRSKIPIWERVAKNVAKGRRRSSARSQSNAQQFSPGAFAPSPGSPHLFPSPVKTDPLHLGWTESTKNRFDEAHTPTHSPTRSNFTHIIGPPRPLDDSKNGLVESESSGLPRPSLIGNVLDSWRENKAQKRREDLKRMIKVVGPEEVAPDQKVSEEEEQRWSRPVLGLQRKLSEFGWV